MVWWKLPQKLASYEPKEPDGWEPVNGDLPETQSNTCPIESNATLEASLPSLYMGVSVLWDLPKLWLTLMMALVSGVQGTYHLKADPI